MPMSTTPSRFVFVNHLLLPPMQQTHRAHIRVSYLDPISFRKRQVEHAFTFNAVDPFKFTYNTKQYEVRVRACNIAVKLAPTLAPSPCQDNVLVEAAIMNTMPSQIVVTGTRFVLDSSGGSGGSAPELLAAKPGAVDAVTGLPSVADECECQPLLKAGDVLHRVFQTRPARHPGHLGDAAVSCCPALRCCCCSRFCALT